MAHWMLKQEQTRSHFGNFLCLDQSLTSVFSTAREEAIKQSFQSDEKNNNFEHGILDTAKSGISMWRWAKIFSGMNDYKISAKLTLTWDFNDSIKGLSHSNSHWSLPSLWIFLYYKTRHLGFQLVLWPAQGHRQIVDQKFSPAFLDCKFFFLFHKLLCLFISEPQYQISLFLHSRVLLNL